MQILCSIKLLSGILSRTFAAYSSRQDFIKHMPHKLDRTKSIKYLELSYNNKAEAASWGIMTKRREKKLLDRARTQLVENVLDGQFGCGRCLILPDSQCLHDVSSLAAGVSVVSRYACGSSSTMRVRRTWPLSAQLLVDGLPHHFHPGPMYGSVAFSGQFSPGDRGLVGLVREAKKEDALLLQETG